MVFFFSSALQSNAYLP